MHYFTREWHRGDLRGGDAEAERLRAAYWLRLEEIGPKLPKEVDLHDGLIERAVWRPATKELALTLVGSAREQDGYLTIDMTYRGALLGRERVNTIRRAAESRRTEILYDEVDLGDAGTLTHRILFWPTEQVTLEFETFELTLAPREDRRVFLLNPFNVEEQDASSGQS